jgi:hypothetical protein
MVVLHHSVAHSHNDELSDIANSVSHQHEDFGEIHHEKKFHIGIFHIIGHLFENINHSNDHSNEHLIVVQKTSYKKVVDEIKTINFFASWNNIVPFSIDAESLPDPPPCDLLFLHQINQPNTPLRAPPALV